MLFDSFFEINNEGKQDLCTIRNAKEAMSNGYESPRACQIIIGAYCDGELGAIFVCGIANGADGLISSHIFT